LLAQRRYEDANVRRENRILTTTVAAWEGKALKSKTLYAVAARNKAARRCEEQTVKRLRKPEDGTYWSLGKDQEKWTRIADIAKRE
jgi:hypothetical protein